MIAGKWFDGQMNALMSFKIVIPVERLRTLITLERTIIRWRRLAVSLMMRRMAAIHMLHACEVTAGEPWHHAGSHVTHKRHLPIRIMYVRHDRSRHSR